MNEPENIENSDQDKPEAAQMDAEIAATAEAVEIDPADAAADADEAAEAAAAEDVAEPNELETALSEVADLKDKLLRAMAETENIKRRGERDKADLRKYAVADFARDMLAVSDNLQRALSAVDDAAREGNAELAQLLEGVDLTRRELQGHFEKHGIKEVNPLGEKLDPNLHQAVVQMDDPEAPQGTVVQVMQPGYVIHDRLLRAAMVGVAKGPGTPKPADDAPNGGHNVDTQA
ncbi:MAG: nucleotide exchange factor GrpE [Rhodospirillaceae bacterium]|jgi:molecular chaperone GrpE|nr:nucleotide exchange factor GrpE [Rhodospirillaceae bacterium]MBT4046494.1 nucleotide exchange factor GrpE [Rhodospirillaceae bacterium]MBT4687704.1 nucleotide exchange factor GrpE [Rhodospirillaceae bacterium]MBT5082872.1 nucleotide exchange factor GrpE [Rhodospirillaceae bacterium]MBT5524316.1 nucleotide exchange factor GrpE [Rhodospirillaceae bacterium]